MHTHHAMYPVLQAARTPPPRPFKETGSAVVHSSNPFNSTPTTSSAACATHSIAQMQAAVLLNKMCKHICCSLRKHARAPVLLDNMLKRMDTNASANVQAPLLFTVPAGAAAWVACPWASWVAPVAPSVQLSRW
jgi:hypothetical protein